MTVIEPYMRIKILLLQRNTTTDYKQINRGYYTAARRYEFYFRVVNTILRTSAANLNLDKSIALHFSPTVWTNGRERAGNDVINILTSEDMENTPLGSRM